MKPDKKQKLASNYRRYCEDRERLAVEGKAIGTFSGWQFENKLVDVVIAEIREEHFGKP